MKSIFEDNNSRIINKTEDVNFVVNSSEVYLIEVAARVNSIESLKIKIDQKEYFNKPAVFSGKELKGLKKSVFGVLRLNSGQHTISLIPQPTGILEQIKIYPFTNELPINDQAEDGDRRPWITFIFVELGLAKMAVTLTLKRRFRDSDDVKIIIDGQIKRNTRSLLHKLWYFVASIFLGESQSETSLLNFLGGIHYVEFWADRMPVLKTVVFSGVSLPSVISLSTDQIKERVREKAVEFGFDQEMVLRLVEKESSFNPLAVSPQKAKGLFQITSKTIEQIAALGITVSDPFDVDQNITGGLTYLRWLWSLYDGQPDRLEKTLAAWNWGMANFSETEPLDWFKLPTETKNFINFVINRK